MLQWIEEVLAGQRAKKPKPTRRQGSAAGGKGTAGKGTRLFREGEDHLETDLVLVEPEAGVDRVEWAKQLVGNAVRSPHTRQAYFYALEQFFVWAAGRVISRESVQGYVTWLGEMKFSPSTINQRLAAIRKLAIEAQRCGYVDSETAQAIVSVAGVSQKGRRLGRWLAWEEARTLLQAPNPHSIRNAGPGVARGAGDVRTAPRGIVAHELRASRHARRPLGVSGFPGEGKQDPISGGAAVGEARD
jgi:hypothetical protein